MGKIIYLVPLLGVLALIFTFIKSAWVSKQNESNARMKEISTHIAEGAIAF